MSDAIRPPSAVIEAMRADGSADLRHDAFISYSHQDRAFALELRSALRERGKDVWLDESGIHPAERWKPALQRAIEDSDSFIFAISPHSATSAECRKEFDYAVKLNKRIIPVVASLTDRKLLPPELEALQFVPPRGEFEADSEASSDLLVSAIETDPEWVREHTEWGRKAIDWDDHGRDASFLLTGSELEDAEKWLARQSGKRPEPSALHNDLVLASRRHVIRRLRRTRSIIAAALAGSLALTAFALIQRNQAIQQRDIAVSGQLATASKALGNANATASQLQSLAAWGVYQTDQARYAMLSAAASPEIATFTGGSSQVTSVAFSPDGKTLATGDEDGTTRLWNLATGQQAASLPVGSNPVESVAFSPDGQVLAVGDFGGTVRLWNVATGRPITSLAVGVGTVYSVKVSGTMLAAGGQNGVRLWDVATGRPTAGLLDGSGGGVLSVAFSPDGKTLADGDGDGAAKLWNVATGQPIGSVPAGSFGHHAAGLPAWLVMGRISVDSVAFSPDGKTLATGNSGGKAQLWDAATGRPIAGWPDGSKEVLSVAFSPDGKMLATGGQDGAAWLWDVATGQRIGTAFSSGSAAVNSVAFSPDGKTLATGGQDGAARLWDVAAGQPTASLATGSHGVWSVAFSPDGKTLATGNTNGKAQLWNVATGQPTASLPAGSSEVDSQVNSVAFSPDGKTLATGDNDGAAKLWNVATGRQVASLPAGSFGHLILVPIVLFPGRISVSSVAFSPDGKTLATGNSAGKAQLWNVRSHHLIASLTAGHGLGGIINSVAFSPDGTMLATGDNDGTARLWDVATHRQIASLATGSIAVWSVAFSPDGTMLATGDNDGTARLWDVATHRQMASLATGSSAVESVAFSPDGKTLATGDNDGAVRLWDQATQQQIGGSISSGSDTAKVAFSTNGEVLATGNDAGTARAWDVGYLVDVVARLCSRVGDSLTQTEWAQYVPPGPSYQNVCSQTGGSGTQTGQPRPAAGSSHPADIRPRGR